jgi:hypothetical protein
MRPDVVVVATPRFDADLGFEAIPKPLQRQVLIAELPVEGFVCWFCHGLPGSTNAVSIAAVCSQLLAVPATAVMRGLVQMRGRMGRRHSGPP